MSGAGTVFLYQMPFGIPGAITRMGNGVPSDVEAQIMDNSNPVLAYGLFGQIDGTTQEFREMAAADATVYGVLVRPFPSQPNTASGISGSVPLGTAAVPPTSGAIDVLKMGYINGVLRGATAAKKNGIVYVRVDVADATHPLGGWEAADDGANTIAVNAYFTGPADANGNVEIAFNIN